MRKSRAESSDEEGLLQDDSSSTSYRDLETFQKAQLRQKVCIANIFDFRRRACFYEHSVLNRKKRAEKINDIEM